MPSLRRVSARVTVRSDTAANWTSGDPVLLTGEIGWESDSTKLKVGDGATAWSLLGYYHTGEDAPGALVHDETRFPASVNSYKGALEYLFDRLVTIESMPDGELGDLEQDLAYLSTDILTEAGEYLITQGGDSIQFN